MVNLKRFLLIMIVLGVSAAGAAAQMAPPPRIVKDKAGKPNWVNQAAAAYDRNFYVAEVGYGSDRQRADNSAFANLTGFFGQSVKSSFAAVESYKERVSGGRVAVQSGVEIEEAISRSSSLDQLIGVEIGDRWYDERNKVYYAVAVMEKFRGIRLYGELLDANLRLIDTTLNIAPSDRATFETMAKYHLAAALADANGVFATVLSLLGGPSRKNELKSGDDYRYEASDIAKSIPVNVVVEGDSEGRIRSAFAAALGSVGFRAGNNSSRYVINAKVSLAPANLPNTNKFTRYVVDASLVDTAANLGLLPHNITGREGHATQ
jgi:hypothetical protein